MIVCFHRYVFAVYIRNSYGISGAYLLRQAVEFRILACGLFCRNRLILEFSLIRFTKFSIVSLHRSFYLRLFCWKF